MGDRVTALQQLVSPFGKVNLLVCVAYESIYLCIYTFTKDKCLEINFFLNSGKTDFD